MGNTKTKFKVDFKQVCGTYADIAEKIILDGSFASKTDELLVWTNTYAECFNNCIKNKTPIESILTSDKLKIIWAIHKLRPVIYHSRKKIDGEWLADACVRQYGFCQKIYPLLSKKNKWIDTYQDFLTLCKKNPTKTIVPTLEQDFMWHSHMQDHNSYVLDMVKIFGKILDHNDNIPDDKLQKYTRETHYLSNKIKYAERKDSTCVVALAGVPITYNSSSCTNVCSIVIAHGSCGSNDVCSGCGGHTSCGGSGCGSSCGGGGCD